MKKLLIMALVVASAVMANAAVVKWSFTQTAKDANSPLSLDSYTAYLFKESAWTAAVTAGVSADTFTSAVNSSGLTKSTGGSGANVWTKWTTGTVTWDSSDASSGNYYVVLSDGNGYIASSAIAATSAASAQDASTPAAWTIAVTKTPIGPGDVQSMNVPEPTSGLLLLLGVAGLALKRKRA